MIADGNRRGYRHLLEGFWDEARDRALPLPTEEPVSAPSFCEARRKIPDRLLRHVIRGIAEEFRESFPTCARWRDRRVFAIDGTRVNLQRSDALVRHFGVPHGAYCPQALVSVLVDVCAKMPVDLEAAGHASSEREHLLALLDRLAPEDILVLDRGYPSHEVFQELTARGIDFLARVPTDQTFKVIEWFRDTTLDDYPIVLDPPDDAPPEWKPLLLRAVRLRWDAGEESIYVTSLPESGFDHATIADLYHMRWEVEEFFKLCKSSYIGQGQYRSRTADGVRQEFHAHLLFLAIARFLAALAAGGDRNTFNEISQKGAVLGAAAYVLRIFLADDEATLLRQLHSLLSRIARTRDKRRPGRSYPRRSYKPQRRWGPQGRRGA